MEITLSPEVETKGARARQQICLAAIEVLIENGYAEASINRVVERSGMSKGALQHHFPTKEDLLFAVTELLLSRALARMGEVRKQPGVADQEVIARNMRDTWLRMINTDSYRALMEVLVASRTDAGLRARVEPLLHDWNTVVDRRMQEIYTSGDGDHDDAQFIMVLNRALMRGLVLQDRFIDDPRYNERVIERWIALAAPLLRLRSDASVDQRAAGGAAS